MDLGVEPAGRTAVDYGAEASQTVAFDAAPVPMVRGEGRFFNETVDLRDPEGEELTSLVLQLYDDVRPRQRKRGRDALTFRVRRVLANALRGHFRGDVPGVLYFAKVDAEWYLDKPGWMKHGALADVVLALKDAGLLTRIKGQKMPWFSEKKSWASSYAPTDYLRYLVMECGVTADSLQVRIPSEDLVQLSEPKPKEFRNGKVHKGRGKRIRFAPTAETERLTAELAAINAFYALQDISLGLSAAEMATWLAAYNAQPHRLEKPYRLPETYFRAIYRVFNEGDVAAPVFDWGGRLAGGWWMSTPEELRAAITINGQATVELDYSECHPRMLYHENRLDGLGKLYELPEIAALERDNGLPAGTYRPCVKWLMQVLINAKGSPELADPPKNVVFPPNTSIEAMIGYVEARHQPIAHEFATGAGLRLMKREADIALDIIKTAMTEGWTVLSIHDSFITTIDKRDRLEALMKDCYYQKMGHLPILKEIEDKGL